MDEKLKKFKEVWDIANKDIPTKKEVAEFARQIIKAVQDAKAVLERQARDNREELNTVAKRAISQFEGVNKRISQKVEDFTREAKKDSRAAREALAQQISQELRKIRTLIPPEIDLSGLEGKLEEIEEQLAELPEPETGETIVEKINDIPDEDEKHKIDVSHISGFEDSKISDYIINRAIGIVDRRTSFLINKVSNLQDQVNRLPVGGGAGTPGGSDTHIQYNDDGAFGGSANFTWDPSTQRLRASTDDTGTIIAEFGRDDGGFESLVEMRTKQTVTSSGNEVGRGAVRMYDRVYGGAQRTLELGFYEFGAGLFYAGGSGTDPFEFWIDSGILSIKGNAAANNYSNRVEVRTPSDAAGVNIESGRYGNVVDSLFGGHIYYGLTDVLNPDGYPFYFRTGDGSGMSIDPLGVTRVGGRLLPAGAQEPRFRILAGDDSQAANLTLGKYSISGSSDTDLFHLRMLADGRSAGFFYGVTTPDATKSWILTDDGRFGFGLTRATTLARMHVLSIETGVPTLLLRPVAAQSEPTQVWTNSSGTTVASMSTLGVLTAVGLVGPLTGNVTGNVTGTAATVTGAAQTAITSLGTLTGLSISGGTLPQLSVNSTGSEVRVSMGIGGVSKFLFNHDGTIGQFGTQSSSGNLALQAGGTIWQTITTTGKIGIGTVTSPTARLHLQAGTATASTAPLKINSGTLLGTTEAGAIENDGTHLYYTAADGGSRFQLDQQTGVGVPTTITVADTTDTTAFVALFESATGDLAPKTDASLTYNASTGVLSAAGINLFGDAADLTEPFWNMSQFRISGLTDPLIRLNIGVDTTTGRGHIQAGTEGTSYNDLILNSGGGKVGIGVDVPDFKLHIKEGGENILKLESTTASGAIHFYEEATLRSIIGFGDSGSIFTGGSNDSLRIRAQGAIHLGTGGDNIRLTISDTGDVTLSGSLGVTGTRVSKGWFTDLEVTNAIVGSVTGNAATVTTNANLTGHITSVGNAAVLGSFTKAQLDTAVSDGNVLYVGDVTQYTDELAQDAIGAMVDTTLVYTDGTPLLSRAALTGDVTAAAGSNATTIAAGAVDIAMLSATGTPDNTTYLRGDNTWATITGGGDVSKVGTPVNNQIGVWTGDGTIKGDPLFTWDSATFTLAMGEELETATIKAPDAAVLNNFGGGLTLLTGAGNNNGNGGILNLLTNVGGDGSTGHGGQINIISGDGGAAGDGGAIHITTGNAGGSNTVGGEMAFTAGDGSGSGGGGVIEFFAGQGGATGVGGDVSIAAGSGGATSGAGGTLALHAGSATAGNSNGGDLALDAGDATGSGTHGKITLRSGGTASLIFANLDTTALTATSKTFAFPNESGTFLTSVSTASALTSVGTLTALQVDNLNINGNTISATSGAVNITPEAGSAIVLDGTINVDAGVVTGATSITSTTFIGALTGNASTVTTNANLTGHITSVGNAAVLGSFTLAQLNTAISDADVATGGGTATGTNTGDQTSIVGITGTKAQFDTAVTDGNFLYSGDITQYTDELAQDAIGAMVDTTLVYTDGTPLLSRAALTGAITASAGSNATVLGSFTKAQLNTAISDGNIEFVESKSITIESPTATEDISLFYTDDAITITKIVAVLVGSATPSVTWTVRHGTDRSAAGTEVVTGGTTTTSVTTGSVVTSFNDATVVADAFVWLETTAQSGTVGQINITVFYTLD